MPKVAVPATLAGISRRGCGLAKELRTPTAFCCGTGGVAERSPTKSTSCAALSPRGCHPVRRTLALAHDQIATGRPPCGSPRARRQVARHGARPAASLPSPSKHPTPPRPPRRPACPPPNAPGRRPGRSPPARTAGCRSASRHCDRRRPPADPRPGPDPSARPSPRRPAWPARCGCPDPSRRAAPPRSPNCRARS